MYVSLDWTVLTDAQRRVLKELGLGPGQRVYILKLNRLSDDDLAAAAEQLDERAPDSPNLANHLAKKFSRRRRTITHRLRQLREAGRRATGADNAGGVAA